MDDLERQLCPQTQLLYIIKTLYMSQMNPKKFLHKTTFSVQLTKTSVTNDTKKIELFRKLHEWIDNLLPLPPLLLSSASQ